MITQDVCSVLRGKLLILGAQREVGRPNLILVLKHTDHFTIIIILFSQKPPWMWLNHDMNREGTAVIYADLTIYCSCGQICGMSNDTSFLSTWIYTFLTSWTIEGSLFIFRTHMVCFVLWFSLCIFSTILTLGGRLLFLILLLTFWFCLQPANIQQEFPGKRSLTQAEL